MATFHSLDSFSLPHDMIDYMLFPRHMMPDDFWTAAQAMSGDAKHLKSAIHPSPHAWAKRHPGLMVCVTSYLQKDR